MNPILPKVLADFLASLEGEDAQLVYQMAVKVTPPNDVTEAIKDATQGKGNDNYGARP